MPNLLETRMFRLNWGNAHSNEQKLKTGEVGVVEPNQPQLEAMLASTLAEINDGGWEIKASLPLTATEFSTQYAPGGKASLSTFAAPFTDGVILLCQRARLVDDETHATIMAERMDRLDRALRDRRETFLRANPISEKRKLIGSNAYLYRGREYASREGAELAQADDLASL
jgi:hypothetical protein